VLKLASIMLTGTEFASVRVVIAVAMMRTNSVTKPF